MLQAARDVIPLAALILLLAVAYAHPRGRVELALGVAAAGACAAVGTLPGAVFESELRHLGPVVILLAAILVVSELLRREGVFAAVGARLRGPRVFLAVFTVAALTTATLSLDATVVLLTPVVLASTAGMAEELATIRLANSASLLLPISNLTNLLALPALGLTFTGYAVRMAPVWIAVLLVEYAVLRLLHVTSSSTPDAEPPPLPRIPLAVVALMLVAFALTSPLGVNPAWVAVAAALVLGLRALRQRAIGTRGLVGAAHVPFAVFVLCLGLVVAALGRGWAGDLLARIVPDRGGLLGLLLLAVVGALIANLVNNLPATLLLVPLVAPQGTTALLALLIGINVGSGLTWTGSLANLLWRRSLMTHGRVVPSRAFHTTAMIATPLALLAGVAVLDVWSAALA